MEPQNSESDTKTEHAPHHPHMGIGDGLRRSLRRRRRDRTSAAAAASSKKTKAKIVKEEEEEEEEEEREEREEIERKIEALQRIVPGGEYLGMEKLFDETAGYIMALQWQVKGLRALTNFFETLEKDKSKLGG